MVISCTSAITQTKSCGVQHMWRLLAGSYFPPDTERRQEKGKASWEISCHPSRWLPFQLSLSLSVTFQQLLFSVGWFFFFLFRHDKGVHSHIPGTASAKQRLTVKNERHFPNTPPPPSKSIHTPSSSQPICWEQYGGQTVDSCSV